MDRDLAAEAHRHAVLALATEPVEIRDVPEPEPGPDEALVEVRAFSLNRGELRLFQIRPEGWRMPWDWTL